MLREIKSILGFLTIIPLGMDQDLLINSARYMPIFPLVGALIGFFSGTLAWVMYQFLPGTIVGVISLGFLLLITGLHHTDGLFDFGDGIMYHGSSERKIEIMHDQLTGAGGLTLGIMTLLTTALSIGHLDANIIIQSLIVIETSAKLSMVVCAWAGKAVHKGMSSSFLEAMHNSHGTTRMLTSLLISFGISLPLLHLAGFITVVTALLTSLVIVLISNRHFGGVTGDVFGATNELSRMTSLVVLLAMVPWA